MSDHDDITRLDARDLFWQGRSVADIARLLDIPYGTVDAWKRRDAWADAPVVVRLNAHVERRLMVMIAKPDKTDRDLNELDRLSQILERTARIEKYAATARESDLNPALERKNARRGNKKEEKNRLTPEQVDILLADFDNGLYEYQRRWLIAKGQYRVRDIMKSRQIGATWYFAREAFVDAILTGDNQIFLSASKAQAHVFREYIAQWVKDKTGVLLQGTPIVLWNNATLYFLGTNSKTAQSYHGHVYMDEYAWICRFLEFRKVASAMATHKKWRITYFSTPSVITHEAYKFWSGALSNRGKPRDQHVEIDISHAALKDGALGPDGQWRNIVTIQDAANGGCDLFDIAALALEYSEQDFANLFMAEWVDDSASFFTFAELHNSMVDSWDVWTDYHPESDRPYDGPVWIGFDPSRTRDNASVVVIAPPGTGQSRYRVLERITFSGADFKSQADAIERLTQRYTVQHIGIDVTGIGQGVYEMVKVFYPAVTPITYSVESKSRMVLKAKHLISRGNLHFDSGWIDVVSAFLSIKKTMTASGRQQTFAASRSDETGHADVAWAIMHALDKVNFFNLDPSAETSGRGGFMEIFD